MRQTITRLWQKPWGKALLAASYSLATILAYFALAQMAFQLWGSTWLPPIGRPAVQEQASTADQAETQRLTQFVPFQPTQAAPQAQVPQAPPQAQTPPPTQDTSGLGPPPIPGQPH